jgi:hypothetical protein
MSLWGVFGAWPAKGRRASSGQNALRTCNISPHFAPRHSPFIGPGWAQLPSAHRISSAAKSRHLTCLCRPIPACLPPRMWGSVGNSTTCCSSARCCRGRASWPQVLSPRMPPRSRAGGSAVWQREMSSSGIIKPTGPLLHHATAFTASTLTTTAHTPAVTARIGREGVLSRRGCGPRACHQRQ